MFVVHLWTLAANVLNKQSQTTVLTVTYCHVTNHLQTRRTWIIRMIKSRIIRWVRHLSYMGVRRGARNVWWGNRRERDYLEGLGIDGG
jgi:hypothetical protein